MKCSSFTIEGYYGNLISKKVGDQYFNELLIQFSGEPNTNINRFCKFGKKPCPANLQSIVDIIKCRSVSLFLTGVNSEGTPAATAPAIVLYNRKVDNLQATIFEENQLLITFFNPTEIAEINLQEYIGELFNLEYLPNVFLFLT